MKLRYDPEADALYILFKEVDIHATKELDQHTIVDYDAQGDVIGVELLFVKEHNPEILEKISIENLTIA